MVERPQLLGEPSPLERQIDMLKNRYHILWILLLAATIRFVQIDSPPVGRHSWRQCDTASVARNFHQNGHRLLYPQIDWEIPGFVEMEFPLYPWVTSLVYQVTGESDAAARILAVLGALASITLIYLIVWRILGRQAAVWSAFLYSTLPLNLFFGRAIMPESWMLAATAASIYFFLRWIDDESRLFYWLALLATALACLLKLTSLYLGLPLLWLAWQKWGRGALSRWQLWMFAGLVTASLLLWYGHAYQLGQTFGASFNVLTAAGSDKWGTWHLLLDPDFYHQVFVGNLGGRMLTWAGFPLFLAGLFLQRHSARERLFDIWLTAVVVMLLLASFGAYQHDYYSLPILFPAVVFMAKVLQRGWNAYKPLPLLILGLVLLLSGYRYLGSLAEERSPNTDTNIAGLLTLETDSRDLVVSCNSANPTWFYLSKRRGWGRDCESLTPHDLHELVRQDARFLVARGASREDRSTASPLGRSFDPLLETVWDSEGVYLARLVAPPAIDQIDWQRLPTDTIGDSLITELWDVSGDSWSYEGDAVIGTRWRGPTEATSRFLFPDCTACGAGMTVTLHRPGTENASVENPRKQRGSNRANSAAIIDLWWRDDGTGMSLHLATKANQSRLVQSQNGRTLESTDIEFRFQEARSYEIELRANGFDLQLLIDGQLIFQVPQRLLSPLSGRTRLRPRLGALRVEGLKFLSGTTQSVRETDRR